MIITHEQAIDYGNVVIWNKLYNKHLFSIIKLPEGHVYEDIAITYKLVYKASSIVILQEALIYQRKWKGSISHTRNITSEQDRFLNQIQKYHDLIQYGYPANKARDTLWKSAIVYCIFIEP